MQLLVFFLSFWSFNTVFFWVLCLWNRGIDDVIWLVNTCICVCVKAISLPASVCYIVYVSCWFRLGPFLLPDLRTELKSTAEPLCVPVSNAGPLIQGVATRRPCAFPSSLCGLVTDKATPALGLLFTKHYVSYSKWQKYCKHNLRSF